MPFMLLIMEPREQRSRRTPEEGRAVYGRMLQFTETLQSKGILQAVSSLRPDREGVRVTVRDGTAALVDGPYAEAKEVVGGWAIMEYPSIKDAADDQRLFAELHAQFWPEVTVISTLRQISTGPEAPGA